MPSFKKVASTTVIPGPETYCTWYKGCPAGKYLTEKGFAKPLKVKKPGLISLKTRFGIASKVSKSSMTTPCVAIGALKNLNAKYSW